MTDTNSCRLGPHVPRRRQQISPSLRQSPALEPKRGPNIGSVQIHAWSVRGINMCSSTPMVLMLPSRAGSAIRVDAAALKQRRHREDPRTRPRFSQLHQLPHPDPARRRRLTSLPTPPTDQTRTMLNWEGPHFRGVEDPGSPLISRASLARRTGGSSHCGMSTEAHRADGAVRPARPVAGDLRSLLVLDLTPAD